MEPKARKLGIAFLLGLVLVLSAVGQATEKDMEVSSSILVNNTLKYDGKEVVYLGEVVGGVMKRGSSAWVNVHDGDYAIGVYASAELLNDTLISGDYYHKGDMIEITGIFHRACNEHGGESDIHARSVRLIARGYAIEHPISMSKVFFTLLLLVINIPFLILSRIKNVA